MEITSYTPSRVQIETNSPENKFLVLTDNDYSGWKAKVDGERTEILKAYSTFKAVKLNSGQHQIEFYYSSDAFKLGAFFSLVGILTLVFVTLKETIIKFLKKTGQHMLPQ